MRLSEVRASNNEVSEGKGHVMRRLEVCRDAIMRLVKARGM